MTRTTFKEKSMKRWSLVIKEASNRQHRPKEDPTTLTSHPETSHNIKLTKREDVRDCLKNSCIYATFGQKTACICRFWPKTCVYTRLLAKNPRMYATFGQKSVYIEKAVVKSSPRVKPINGSVIGQTYYKIRHRNREKTRASQ